MHEMFHSLGRWHEQSRPDRNIYIQIIEDNIQSGKYYCITMYAIVLVISH